MMARLNRAISTVISLPLLFMLLKSDEPTENVSTKRLVRPDLRERSLGQLRPNGKFSFVHISKCGGASWIRLLNSLSLNLYPRGETAYEHSVWYQRNVACKDADYTMTSMRSPRHHAWSLFSECKYSDWGKRRTSDELFPRSGLPPFPRSGDTDRSDEVDFDVWLDHFVPVEDAEQGGDYYNCYHPANFQSRALTSREFGPRGLEADKARPDANLAMETYWSFDFVALVEFFHESRCLFYHRLGPDASGKAASYLEDACRCDRAVGGMDEVHVKHHELGRRPKLRDLPQYTLSKVDELTEVDARVYVTALWQFMVEIAWLESDAALGRRVLCDGSLRRAEPELAYLDGGNFNVTEVYVAATKGEVKTGSEPPVKAR